MNKRLLLFNVIFYGVTLTFFLKSKQDPSSSFGYGMFIALFWGVAVLALAFLVGFKVITPKTILDKTGIVLATPFPCILTALLLSSFIDTPVSESYFNKDKYRYKQCTFNYNGTTNIKRIEFYKSADTIDPAFPFKDGETWVKDSTWIYYSKSGEIKKTEEYKNNVRLR